MALKRLFALIICILLSLSFTGCAVVDLDVRNMMEAPRNDADMAEVTAILDGGGRADYCYPQNGDYREAVIFTSFTGKSHKDAFSFTYDNSKRINITFFSFIEGAWVRTKEFTDKADQVERVVFGDITGDGINDIIVGFTDSEERNVISIFTCSEEKNEIEKIDTKFYYDAMLLTRFRTNDKDELCVVKTEEAPTDENGSLSFSVYHYSNKKFYSIGKETLPTRLLTFEKMFFDKDADGKAYVAAEGMGNTGVYITQIFTENRYTEKIYSPYSINPDRTTPGEFKRGSSDALFSMDIDGDGSMEIPLTYNSGEIKSSSAGYVTDWVKPTLNNVSKKTVMSTIVNYQHNYYVPIPEEKKDNILHYKGSDQDSLDIYEIEGDGEGNIEKATKLFTVRVFTKPQWKEYTEGEYLDYTLVLDSRGDAVYAVKDLYRCETTEYMLENFGCLK